MMWIDGLESSAVGAIETRRIPDIHPISSGFNPSQVLDVQIMTPFCQGDITAFFIVSETLSIFASR